MCQDKTRYTLRRVKRAYKPCTLSSNTVPQRRLPWARTWASLNLAIPTPLSRPSVRASFTRMATHLTPFVSVGEHVGEARPEAPLLVGGARALHGSERRGTPCRPAKRLCGAGTILRTSPLGPLVTRDARPGHRMCRLALHNKQWLIRLAVTNF